MVAVDLTAVKESELLPRDWNSEAGVYCLLYIDGQGHSAHLLKVVCCDGEVLVHLLRMTDKVVADASFNCSDYCTGDVSSFSKAYKRLEDLQRRLDKEVVEPFSKESVSSSPSERRSSHKTHRDPPTHDPLRAGPARQGGSQQAWPGSADPFSIGRGDLDPLAGPSAGGMVMDPMRGGRLHPGPDSGVGGLGMPGRLPRGSVPPGARFDPIGPPDFERGGHRAGPDPDHMRPPGFEDDMYM